MNRGHGDLLDAVGLTLTLMSICVVVLVALTAWLARANGWTPVARTALAFAVLFTVVGVWYGIDRL